MFSPHNNLFWRNKYRINSLFLLEILINETKKLLSYHQVNDTIVQTTYCHTEFWTIRLQNYSSLCLPVSCCLYA